MIHVVTVNGIQVYFIKAVYCILTYRVMCQIFRHYHTDLAIPLVQRLFTPKALDVGIYIINLCIHNCDFHILLARDQCQLTNDDSI